tara:strand:+ start:119 stop:481 length:363 start_codon:yes stop_codon:yes gene_type:complete
MKVTYTNTKLEVMPNIVTDPKKMIIEYLQRLELTQFVPYDSDNNFPIDKNTGCCKSYSFSYEEIEFLEEYTIKLQIDADYKVYCDGYHKLITLKCEGDVRNSDGDIVLSEQEIKPHLNTI